MRTPIIEKPIDLEFASSVVAKPGETFSRSMWNHWSFEYVTEGKGYFTIGGKTHTLIPGDVYVLPKGLSHRYSADIEEPWKKIFFGIKGKGVDSLLEMYGLNTIYTFPESDCKLIFEEILHASNNKEIDNQQVIALKFHELCIRLAKITKRGTSYSSLIYQTLELLNNSIEKNLSLFDIANEMNISKSHLNRKFKNEVGVTPYDYLINLRMHKASRLLTLTQLSIKKIAEMLCYADAFYFSNAFKKNFGVSPALYRQKKG